MDPEKLKDTAKLVFGALGGAMTSTMIYLGDRLGLYRELAAGGDATSAELAGRTGLDERWLREWLYQQGAAGVLEHRGDERFGLSDEAAAVLAHEEHPAFGAGFFSHLPQSLALAERLPESSSLMCTALSAPMARQVRSSLVASPGPRVTIVTSPSPAASLICSAASTANSS